MGGYLRMGHQDSGHIMKEIFRTFGSEYSIIENPREECGIISGPGRSQSEGRSKIRL